MRYYDKLVFELSKPGRSAFSLPQPIGDATVASSIDGSLLRSDAPVLPSLSEPDVVRHYTNLSQMNFGVDTGFYPLGSCTMKYNPKINEEITGLFAGIHPLQPGNTIEGVDKVYQAVDKALAEITGMCHFTFQPCAGAHGELTGLMIIRQYHMSRGDAARTRIIVPDSAHGTNPASAAVCGLEVVQVKSGSDGLIDVEALKPLLGDDVAGIMMTNPNTLGLFEKNIREIASLVHSCGGLLYYDGANMNPLLGIVRPGDMGFDVMHLNLHKSFSTPHGGGGPGSGPVGVAKHLVRFLPEFNDEGMIAGKSMRVSGFHGNFGVILRAYAYILTLGRQNLKMAGRLATLSANYIKESLKDCYKLPIESICKHEFVFDGLLDGSATTLDIAKRLLDYGFHAPTIYFPLLFHQAIMIEPTETESIETLDAFIAVMRRIAEEAAENPDLLKGAPHTTPIGRPDETLAARRPVLKWTADEQ